MKLAVTLAFVGANALMGADAQAEYLNAFEKSVQSGPADAERFLARRLHPDEQKQTKLRAADIALPDIDKPPGVLHRRALIFIPHAKLEALEKSARDYSSQHRLYSKVLRHSSLCSGAKTPYVFRYWTTTSWKDTITENEAAHERVGPRYQVSSRLHGIRLVNGDDRAQSQGHPDLDLCQLSPVSGQEEFAEKWQFQEIRTVWRFEETSDGVYVETNSVAVMHRSGIMGIIDVIAFGPLKKALDDLNDEVLRVMAGN